MKELNMKSNVYVLFTKSIKNVRINNCEQETPLELGDYRTRKLCTNRLIE